MNGILFIALLAIGFGYLTLYSRMVMVWCEHRMKLASKDDTTG
ncbi:hypothetical protein [Vibrio algarum]|uniref:Uncharacterized protein n=1 Tax=Vibrio algarum TaxID=3020714 RepID=A0ABT4YRS1_9VIBR|nr:hypothetical protein [Vibrio sp. KJ40-1]MDB1124252.1 hypothetical protein [Vibrio sp. KJ40-1]